MQPSIRALISLLSRSRFSLSTDMLFLLCQPCYLIKNKVILYNVMPGSINDN